MNFRIVLGTLILSFVSHLCWSQDFISIDDEGFKLGNAPYFPMNVNYMTRILDDGNDWQVTGESTYGVDPTGYECRNDLSTCPQVLGLDIDKILEAGFNSIRLVGGAVPYYHDGSQGLGFYLKSYDAVTLSEKETLLYPNGELEKYILMLKNFLSFVDSKEVKTILVTVRAKDASPINQYPSRNETTIAHYESFLAELGEGLKNEPGLLAIDLMNEPEFKDYHHQNGNNETPYSKEAICGIVSRWYDAFKSVPGNNHLVTLGGGGDAPRSMRYWDFNVLKLDFYSLHLYPVNNNLPYDYVKEMQKLTDRIIWVQKTINKPFIMGEIGFSGIDEGYIIPPNLGIPLENQSTDPPHVHGTEAQQKLFAEYTLQMTKDCGVKGYSWWQHQHITHGSLQGTTDPANFVPYRVNFYGVYDFGDGQNYGEPKEIIKGDGVFKLFMEDPTEPDPNKCLQSPYYFNKSEFAHEVYQAKTFDYFHEEIEAVHVRGGVSFINGNNEKEFNGFSTTTSNEEGALTLYTKDPKESDEEVFISYLFMNYPGSNTLTFEAGLSVKGFPVDAEFGINNLDMVSLSTIQNYSSQNGEKTLFQSNNNLEALNAVISDGTKIDFKATLGIELKSDFLVEQGAQFSAYIGTFLDDCFVPEIESPDPERKWNLDLLTEDHEIQESRVSSINGIRFNYLPIISVYPNPASTYINVRSSDSFEYILFDNAGRVLKKGHSSESIKKIYFGEIEGGPLFLRVVSQNSTKTFKLIIIN